MALDDQCNRDNIIEWSNITKKKSNGTFLPILRAGEDTTYNADIKIIRQKPHIICHQKQIDMISHPYQPTEDYNWRQIFGDWNLTEAEENNIIDQIQRDKLILGLDGSVTENVGAFAFGFFHPNSRPLYIQHKPVLGDCDQQNSGRAEMFGILGGLILLDKIIRKHSITTSAQPILILGDNIHSLQMAHHGPSNSLKNTFLTDADIALEIHHQIKKSPLTFSTKHVKAHQDDTNHYDSLDEHARINVQCDRKASEYYQHRDLILESKTMIPHLQAQKISLRNPFTRITTDYRAAIIQYKVGHAAESQCSRTWKIQTSFLTHINWTALRQVLRSTRGRKRFAYIKAIHTQWPTMEREFKWGRSLTNICPHCSQLEDTIHVFQCKNIIVKANRIEALTKLKKSLQRLKTHPTIFNHMNRIIH